MALKTQVKSLRFYRDILLSNSTAVLPYQPDRKPDFEGRLPTQRLPRSTPEQQGIPSGALSGLYTEIAAAPGACAHALLVARHGQVVSEGWFAPYRPGVWHVTHSLCKSFTGTAVGLAVSEGLFGLDDKVADYFPEHCTLLTGRRMRCITVRHLLTMSSGITFNEMGEALEKDWLSGIFESEIAFEPGSRMVYNSMNSYLLSALIKKTSGTGLLEFLTPRIFAPMGFGQVAWEKCPLGIEKGGWGMYLDPEDMLKFGQLFLQGGVWQTPDGERRLIPADWLAQMTRTQITGKDGEYGFQIWTHADDGSYLMNGMFGQYVAVFPKQDIVAVMTAGNGNLLTDSVAYARLRAVLAAPGFAAGPIAADRAQTAELARVLAALRFDRPVPPPPQPSPERFFAALARRLELKKPAPAPAPLPPAVLDFTGVTWRFEISRGGLMPMILQFMDGRFSNGIRALRIEPDSGRLMFYWEEGGETLCFPAGLGCYAEGSFSLAGERFLTAARADLRTNEDDVPVLKVEICLPESSSTRRLKLLREGEGLQLRMDESPSLAVAVDKVNGQAENTGSRNFIQELLLGGDYTQYRMGRLILPVLHGKPVHAGDAVLSREGREILREVEQGEKSGG